MRENIDCTQVIRWKSQSVDGWMAVVRECNITADNERVIERERSNYKFCLEREVQRDNKMKYVELETGVNRKKENINQTQK